MRQSSCLRTLVLSILLPLQGLSQVDFDFKNLLINCVDRWVVFQREKDSTWALGFVYFDTQAGLTLNYEGKMSRSAEGVYSVARNENGMFKYRLQPNQVQVALLPENKFEELGIKKSPDWLAIYNRDTTSITRLYKRGFALNAWGECARALDYLSRASQADPKYPGLTVEMSFSYNCLEQYDKAIALLEAAISNNPDDAYLKKELIYSHTKSGDLPKAGELLKKALAELKDTSYHAESCYNLLYSYFMKKDKKNFAAWLDETKKWGKGNEQITKSIGLMEKELAKN
jgi:tetratricopeptide (TPR) repeat protein